MKNLKKWISGAVALMMLVSLFVPVTFATGNADTLLAPDMTDWTAGTYTNTQIESMSENGILGDASSTYTVNADGSLTVYKAVLAEDATEATVNAYAYLSIGEEIAYADFDRSIEFNLDVKSDAVQAMQADGTFADVTADQGGSRYLAFWYTDANGKKQIVKLMGMSDLGVFSKRSDYPDGGTVSGLTVTDDYYSLKIVLSKEASAFTSGGSSYAYGWRADVYDKNNNDTLKKTVRFLSEKQGTDGQWKVLPSIGGIMFETYLGKAKSKTHESRVTIKNVEFTQEAAPAEFNWDIDTWAEGTYTDTELASLSGNGILGATGDTYTVNADGSLSSYQAILADDATAATANAYTYLSIGEEVDYADFEGNIEFNLDVKSEAVLAKQADGSMAAVTADQGGSRYLGFWYTTASGAKQFVKLMGMNDLGKFNKRADYPDGYTPSASTFTVNEDGYYSFKIVLSKEASSFTSGGSTYSYGWKADIYDKNNTATVKTVRFLGEKQGTDTQWKVLPSIGGIMFETYLSSGKSKTHESRVTIKNTSFTVVGADSGEDDEPSGALFEADFTDTTKWGAVGTTYTAAELQAKNMKPAAGTKQNFEITANGLKFTPSTDDNFESTQTMTINFNEVATGTVVAELELLVAELGTGESALGRQIKFNTSTDPIAVANLMTDTSGLTPSGANFKHAKGLPSATNIAFTQSGETDKYIKVKVVASRAAADERWSYATYDMNNNDEPMTISMSHRLDTGKKETANISSIGINIWRSSSTDKSKTQATTLKSAKVYLANDAAAAYGDTVINEEATKTALTLSDNTATFTGTVYSRGVDQAAAKLIIAGYDASGVLMGITATDINGITLYTAAAPLTYTFDSDVASAKVMIWDGYTGAKSLVDVIETNSTTEP